MRRSLRMCERCGEHPVTTDGESFCPICIISIKVEVARGMKQIASYLEAWAAFRDWCAAHGRDLQAV